MTIIYERPSRGASIVAEHRLDLAAIRWRLDDSGVASCEIVRPDRSEGPSPDLILARGHRDEVADLAASRPSRSLMAATSVLCGTQTLACWGLPPAVDLGWDDRVAATLAVECPTSPFGTEEVIVQFRIGGGRVTTRVGAPVDRDLTVRCQWAALVAWAATPEVLLGDVAGAGLCVGGHLAVLSTFEGALHRAATLTAPPADALRRWSEMWSGGRARRDLLHLAPAVARELGRVGQQS